ncbi:PorT family protein [Dyadobacter sp. CY345]|uniref:PorT family protein n=1 Tax=Dyadobacter sp. CY345 TaxID=2909335 RepID=UPI001F3E2DBA|nr:PorT family protein [Dyadobacter sp. CY345]MCF2447229.1 PorT family protein [Dyadobacter sp. CY345]
MKYHLFSICSVVLSLFCNPLFAQKNYEPGYVISAKNDTINGFIEYLNWSKNPEKIYFKSQQDGAEKKYGFDDLNGFGVHGESYVRAEILVNENSDKTSELPSVATTKMRSDTAFLMVLAGGAKSLYYFNDPSGKSHFYIKSGEKFEWLVYYRYRVERDNQSGIVTVDGFKKQLADYFQDCPSVLANTKFVTYSQRTISKLFESYNKECQPTANIAIFNTEKIVSRFGVLAGVSVTNLRFKGEGGNRYLLASLPSSSQVAGGVFLNLILPRTKQRVSVYNELFFTSFKTSNHLEEYVSDQDFSSTDYTIGFGYLKLNNFLRYKIPSQKLNLYLNLGISNGIAITESNTFRTETTFFSDKGRVTTGKALESVRKYEQGLLAGVGVTIKKYSLEARYERGNGMSAYQGLNSLAQRFYLLLAYQF